MAGRKGDPENEGAFEGRHFDTERWTKTFIRVLAETGIVKRACEACGKSYATAYARRAKFPKFREAWLDALEQAADELEYALRERGLGWKEPIVVQGKLVGHKWVYSDTAAIVLLKGLRPEKYKDNYNIVKVVDAVSK